MRARSRRLFRRRPRRFPMRDRMSLIPGLMTLGNLCFGMMAILHVLTGQYTRAAWLMVVAAILDGLDGLVARATRSTSPLGLQLDSLADLVSFGVAPTLLMYRWTPIRQALPIAHSFAVAMTLYYVACTALRLARFNVLSPSMDRRYFIGLPAPGAGSVLFTLPLMFSPPSPRSPVVIVPFALMGILGSLMISNIRYRSLKQLEIHRRWPLASMATVALILSLVITHPRVTLWSVSTLYALSGLAMRVVLYLKRVLRRRVDSAVPTSGEDEPWRS